MYLSVQLAARRLGVSPHTVRRWTASGLLPCTRTAGGHRRIKQEDVDELAHLIGGRNHLATRLAREREVELLVEAAESLSDTPAGEETWRRLARCTAALLEASAAYLWEIDAGGGRASLLAGHGTGRRLNAAGSFALAQAPAARRALAGLTTVAVRAGDPRADEADIALLRRDGDGGLLMVPLIAGDQALGLLDIRDRRERAYSRQETRLAGALGALGAAALERERLRRRVTLHADEDEALRDAITRISGGLSGVRGATVHDTLWAAARLAVEALGGVSCVAGRGAATAGAAAGDASEPPGPRTGAAHVLVASAGEGALPVVLTLTLPRPAAAGHAELLAVLAAATAAAADAVPTSEDN